MDVIPSEWVKFFPTVELPVMVAIGVVAFVLQRSNIGKGWSLMIPLGLGTLYGIVGAIDAGTSNTASYILKGALMNGAGASVCAHGVDLALQKWWPQNTQLNAMTKGISEAAATQAAVEAGAVPTVQVQADPSPPKP